MSGKMPLPPQPGKSKVKVPCKPCEKKRQQDRQDYLRKLLGR